MGQAGGLVQVDIRDHQQFQLLQGLSQPAGVGHGQQRIAAGYEQRLYLFPAGGEYFVGQYAAGKTAIQFPEAADAGAGLAPEHTVPFGVAGKVEYAFPHQGAAAPVQVAGDGADTLRQPLGQGTVLAHPQPRTGHDGRSVGGAVGGHQVAQRLRGDTGDRGGFFGRPFLHRRAQRLQARAVALHGRGIITAAGEHLLQEGQEEKHVGVGAYVQVLPRHLGRFRVPRIDHDNATATGPDLLEALHRVGYLQERPLGYHRVGTHHQHALHIVEVDKGLVEREAVHLGGGGEAVGAILGGGGEDIARTDTLHETLGKDGVQDAEARGRAHVHTDGVGTYPAQLAQLATNFTQCLVPGDAFEAVPHPLQGIAQPVGRVVHLVLVQAFHAGKAQGTVVFPDGRDRHHTLVLYPRDNAATGLAYTTERVPLLNVGHEKTHLSCFCASTLAEFSPYGRPPGGVGLTA